MCIRAALGMHSRGKELNTSVFLESRFASAFCSYEFLRAHTRHTSPRYPINRIDLSPLAIIQGVVTRPYIIL